jgi:hypothetical protein
MSKTSIAFLGAVAATLTLGAVQLASGHDLVDRWQIDRWQAVADKPTHNVNRAAKADRIGGLKASAVPTRTVSLRLNDLADTSVLLRVPFTEAKNEAKNEAKSSKQPTLLQTPTSNRKPVACEAVVSSLTEIAKLLQPGRCVT